MRTPGEARCDLCGQLLTDGRRVIQIHVPLTEDVRVTIREQLNLVPPPPSLSRIFGFVALADGAMPNHWTLEVCGCVLGFLPMLPDVVIRGVQTWLTRKLQDQAIEHTPLEKLSDL